MEALLRDLVETVQFELLWMIFLRYAEKLVLPIVGFSSDFVVIGQGGLCNKMMLKKWLISHTTQHSILLFRLLFFFLLTAPWEHITMRTHLTVKISIANFKLFKLIHRMYKVAGSTATLKRSGFLTRNTLCATQNLVTAIILKFYCPQRYLYIHYTCWLHVNGENSKNLFIYFSQLFICSLSIVIE